MIAAINRSVAMRSVSVLTSASTRWLSGVPTGGPATTCIVLRGRSRSLRPYGAITSCAPQIPSGISGAPVASAMRAAPVLPVIGHRSGSLVIVPSGYTTTHSPRSTATPATALTDRAASTVSR